MALHLAVSYFFLERNTNRRAGLTKGNLGITTANTARKLIVKYVKS